MTNFFKLFSLFLKNNLRKGEKKSKGTIAAIIVIALLAIPFIGVACVAVYFYALLCAQAGIANEFFTTILTTSQVPTLIFGVFSMLNVVIFAKDWEFLEALPVKKWELFLAKFAVVYVDDVLLSTVILIPLSIAFGIAVGAGVIFYLLLPLVIFLLPVFPLVICALLVFPLMYVVSFFKKRGALSAVLMILVFAGLMFAYMSVIPKGDVEEENITLTLSPILVSLVKGVHGVMLPVRCITLALLEQNTVLNLLAFLIFVAVALILSALIASPLYKRAVALQSETSSRGGREIKFAQADVITSYVIKDFKQLIRFPAFAFQSFAGMILTPIITAFMTSSLAQGMVATEGIDFSLIGSGIVMFYAPMLLIGTNYTAMAAFTREGQAFYYNKILPISIYDILKAKLLFSNVVTVIGSVLTGLVLLLTGASDFASAIMTSLCLTLLGYGMNSFGIKRDLKRPRLNWNNVNEAIKNNSYMAVPMFLMMGIGVLFVALSIVAFALTGVLFSSTLASVIFWAIAFLISMLVAIICRGNFYNNTEEYIERIEL